VRKIKWYRRARERRHARGVALVAAAWAAAFTVGPAPAGAHHLDPLFSASAPATGSRAASNDELRAADAGEPPLRVYVVVVDGLRPQEIGPLTPNLAELRAGGTWYEQARAVFPAETLPNHAAMATGVLPQRNGIVANQIWRGDAQKEYMQYPEFFNADTLVTRLERSFDSRGGIATATLLSKEYLFGAFRGEHEGPADPHPQRQADFHWDPRTATPLYVPDPSNHAVDQATMENFLGWIRQRRDAGDSRPQFAFVNLGDVDRAGHADPSGAAFAGGPDDESPLAAGDVSVFRQGVLEDTDTQIGRLVDELKQLGAWEESVLLVLSDHGMDWGQPDRIAQIKTAIQGAGYTLGPNGANADFWIVGGGGTELVYVHHDSDLPDIARIVEDAEGVAFVSTRTRVPGVKGPTNAELGIDHPYSPDIQAFMKPSYRSSPTSGGGSDNPLPGNHGHAITQHSALMVAGGHPLLREGNRSVPGETVYEPGEKLFADPRKGPGSMSVAPTVAALFGVGAPPGGYDGPGLADAFDPGVIGADGNPGPGPGPGPGPSGDPGGGPGRLVTTLVASTARASYGKRFTLSGMIGGDPACGDRRRVTVYAQPVGAAASNVIATSVAAGPDGSWSHSIRASTSAVYRAVVQPTPACGGSESASVSVPVRARVAIRKRCGATSTLSGYVRPRAPRTKVVLQRFTRGRYRRVAAGRLDSASRFRFLARPCSGRFRVVWPSQGLRNVAGETTFKAARRKR
jgi:hypothetical protein